MPATKTQNARVKIVSQWLKDEFGEDDERDIEWSKDAEDLIKFLKSNGWSINPHHAVASNRRNNDEPQPHRRG